MTRMDRHTDLIARTLWMVETELADAPDLATLARGLGVSPFHLTRAFALATGQPLMSYVRARRLSEAAQELARAGATVTAVAMGAGYDSAEGFTRAFRSRFGLSPAEFRAHPNLESPYLQEALTMTANSNTPVTGRIETYPGAKVRGLAARYTLDTRARIPALWGDFVSGYNDAIGGSETFGICYDFGEDGSFAYMCAVPDDGRAALLELEELTLPKGRYAVFDHQETVATLPQTWDGAFSAWLPQNGLEVAPGAPEFELYSPRFDPNKPGGVAVWLPLKAAD